MSTTLNDLAYAKILREDLEWLARQPYSLERDHIRAVLLAQIATTGFNDRCEHDIPAGEWCEPCNRAYKAARLENGDDEQYPGFVPDISGNRKPDAPPGFQYVRTFQPTTGNHGWTLMGSG